MASFFSIVVINPEDWDSFLEGQEVHTAVLTYDPANAQTPTYVGMANGTCQEFFFKSDTGCPPDGDACLTILVDTVDPMGKTELRDVIYYVGKVEGGESFIYDEALYPIEKSVF